MSEVVKRQYEAMFVFDPSFASPFENCEGEIQRLMERVDGEIIICQHWDERRLAFKIKGRKRGVYVLTYFLAPSSRIKQLERDAQLSEHVLRVLVLTAEGLTREAMQRWAGVAHREESEDRDETRERRGHREAAEPRREDRPPRARRARAEAEAAAGSPAESAASET